MSKQFNAMKKIFIFIFSVIFASVFLTSQAAANATGGSIGEMIEFESVGGMLEYVKNEQWQSERWYDPSQDYTKIDYLKRMPEELFLPTGYAEDDIEKIKLDDVMVWVYLSDGKLLNYWFTEYVPNQKPTKICTPTEFRLLPGTNDVWDIPEVYNIFEQDKALPTATVPQPAEMARNRAGNEEVKEA